VGRQLVDKLSGNRATASVFDRLRLGGRVVSTVHDRRAPTGPGERSLTRIVDGYEITQTDEQRPTGGGEFDWHVESTVTAPSGEQRQVLTTTTLGRSNLRCWNNGSPTLD
jgi:hypothetical protein